MLTFVLHLSVYELKNSDLSFIISFVSHDIRNIRLGEKLLNLFDDKNHIL